MFYDKFSIGHLVKYINPPEFDQNWFGIIKCKVLPPQNLYIPVLPVKVNTGKAEKLIFHLCLKCSKQNIQEECSHTPVERQFVGTWSTVEVHKAVEVGYEIKEIYEVWHFEHSTEWSILGRLP